ncbi:ABC transporter substrate-binding protein [Rossellomorea vietnamensis]|uniref:ABC transporter substrate-binding protein n=2 Tax=Rossellomorea TaxID=2837508 RepID=A0A5D4KAX8_9BACI|nr:MULTISPECIES: ABC transporter substrate-binding protein [Rossellomorea]TYR74332.1 ABC transporter substrate-binding protein [Rossellomorea vietnamensis]TYS77045.1 ABC transporter substrate-binding protein [Rossellomorea aquimaris]
MKNTKTIFRILGIMGFFLLILTGCSSENQTQTDIQDNSEPNEYPRTISHMKGQTEISGKPQNAAVLGFEDELLALDIKPSMVSSYSGVGVLPYIDERTKGASVIEFSEGFNLEQLLSTDPEYIVIPHYFEAQYEQLNKIAPTIVIDSSDWKTAFKTVAEIYAEEDKAIDVIQDIQTKSTEVKEIADLKFSQENFMLLRVQKDNQFLTYGYGSGEDHDLAILLHELLGLSPAPQLPKERFHQISLEGLTTFEADHFFVINDYEPEALIEMEETTIWNTLPAVAQGNVLVNSELIGQSSGPLGKQIIIEDVRNYLSQ